jgi:hypothetical protein
MTLQFNPPTDLVNAYLQRPSPGQIASQGINQALQDYATLKEQDAKSKNDALQTLLKASDSVDLSDPATAKAFAPLYKQAGVDPAIFQPPTPSTGTVPNPQPVTAGLPNAQGQPVTQAPSPVSSPTISPLIQASLAVGHPDHSGIMAKVGDPNQLIKTGFGRKKLAAAESAQKLSDAQQKEADKNSPTSFDYATAKATASGTPDAANPFIDLAKKEGRTALTQKEMADMKDAITAQTQMARANAFETTAQTRKLSLRDQLVKEARTTLDPYFQSGAGKQQAERLNRIGRADALVQQMQGQAGSGDTRQMRELATSLASVLTGGNVVAEQQINELMPQTYKGNWNRFVEKLTNNPTGLDQQAFVSRLSDTLNREKTTIQKQARTVAERSAPTLRVLKDQYPEDYNAVVNQYLNNSPEIMGTPTSTPISTSGWSYVGKAGQ